MEKRRKKGRGKIRLRPRFYVIMSLFFGTLAMFVYLIVRPAAPMLEELPVFNEAPPEMDSVALLDINNPLSHLLVAIDPGHGGIDDGAIAYFNGQLIRESEVVLSISLELERLLTQAGIQVVMTRRTDEYVDLGERTLIANHAGADLLISVHNNSFISSEPSGIETLYFQSHDQRAVSSGEFAGVVQDRLVEALNLLDRGARPEELYILRWANMPGILVEIGFMSNLGDLEIISSPYGQSRSARAIYLGLLDYFQIRGYQVPPEAFLLQ